MHKTRPKRRVLCLLYTFMQKPKNLLPGLFLCVFSRTAEPLVDFYCSNLLAFPPFLFGADFFCRKERYCRPILYRPILRADSTKNAAHTTPLQRGSIWHAAAPHKRPPLRHAPNRLKTILLGPCTANLALFTHTKGPHAKTPGVIPGVWLMKNSFNLRLTHCGRFLAGCTGPACSRRPQ